MKYEYVKYVTNEKVVFYRYVNENILEYLDCSNNAWILSQLTLKDLSSKAKVNGDTIESLGNEPPESFSKVGELLRSLYDTSSDTTELVIEHVSKILVDNSILPAGYKLISEIKPLET